MKVCLIAASVAVGVCLFAGGCGSSCGDSAGGEVAAIRQELDQLKADMSKMKARLASVEARARAPMSGDRDKPHFTGEPRSHKKVDKARSEEMRRRHEEHMRRIKEIKEKEGKSGAADAAAPAAAK